MQVCTYTFNFSDNESDCGPHEGLNNSDDIQCLLATPKERYLHGMLKGREYSRANVGLDMRPDGERGAYAARPFLPGDFIVNTPYV